MSSSDQLNILNLNPDLKRIVIKMGVEDIDRMRTISPNWNYLAQHHMNTRIHLPAIEKFSWNNIENLKLNKEYSNKLSLSVPERFRKYFGACNWESIVNPTDNANDYEFDFNSTGLDNELEFVSDRVCRMIARASRIGKLDISGLMMTADSRNKEFKAIKNAINGIQIQQVLINATLVLSFEVSLIHDVIEDVFGNAHLNRIQLYITFASLDFNIFLPVINGIMQQVSTVELIWKHTMDHFLELMQNMHNNPKTNQIFTETIQRLQKHQQLFQQMLQVIHLHDDNWRMPTQIRQLIETKNRTACNEWTVKLNETDRLTANMLEQTVENGVVQFRIVVTKKQEDEGPSSSKKRKIE